MSVVCLIKHHVAHTYGGVEVQLHALLTSAACGGELHASPHSSVEEQFAQLKSEAPKRLTQDCVHRL